MKHWTLNEHITEIIVRVDTVHYQKQSKFTCTMRANKKPFNLSVSIPIFFVILLNSCNSGKVYDVLLSEVFAACNPAYCNVSISANGSLISMSFDIKQRLDNVFINIEVGGKSQYGQYHTLTNKTMVLCEFIHDRMKNPFIGMIYDWILKNKQNRMFTSCPLMPVRCHIIYCCIICISGTNFFYWARITLS